MRVTNSRTVCAARSSRPSGATSTSIDTRSPCAMRPGATALLTRSEMPRRERASRPGLQILLESHRLFLRRKLQRYDQRPGSMVDCMAAGAMVVPLETRSDVARDTDVMPGRIDVAADDVDEALRYAMHGSRKRIIQATKNSSEFRELGTPGEHLLRSGRHVRIEESASAFAATPLPPSRCRHGGQVRETAFA